MHANGSGGVAQTVTPRFVFLLWGLETNYGILHVHRNVNYIEMKTRRVVFSQSNKQQPRAEDSSFSQYWKEQAKSQHQRTKTYKEGRGVMSRERPRRQLLIVFHQVSPSSHQRVKTKHRDRSGLSVNIRQEIRAPAGLKVSLTEPEPTLYCLQACKIKNWHFFSCFLL